MPGYLIVSGAHKGEGAIITRNYVSERVSEWMSA